jgi:hypothetical protein
MDKAYKVIDGVTHVAVLYSPGHGAGWYSWNTEHKEILFDPVIVSLVEEQKEHIEIYKYLEATYGEDVYIGGVEQLTVRWLPEGTLFTIKQYDGWESIQTIADINWEIT